MANRDKVVTIRMTTYEKWLLDKLCESWVARPSDVIRQMIFQYGNRMLEGERANLDAFTVGRDTQQPAPEANNEN